MKGRKEPNEILFDIKSENPEFNKEDLLEYTKWAIQNLHDALKNDDIQKVNVRCEREVIDKLLKEKNKYRITSDIDRITVQHMKLFDYIKENDNVYIKVYISIYFYDNVKNNYVNVGFDDKYWNDIWIITYRQNARLKESKKNSNCFNCGAVMEYDRRQNIFKCEYCGNIVYNESDEDWKIIDIELGV